MLQQDPTRKHRTIPTVNSISADVFDGDLRAFPAAQQEIRASGWPKNASVFGVLLRQRPKRAGGGFNSASKNVASKKRFVPSLIFTMTRPVAIVKIDGLLVREDHFPNAVDVFTGHIAFRLQKET